MVDFALGYSPKIHVNIRKINISDVPYESEEEVGRWLHSCFERKDKYVSISQVYYYFITHMKTG